MPEKERIRFQKQCIYNALHRITDYRKLSELELLICSRFEFVYSTFIRERYLQELAKRNFSNIEDLLFIFKTTDEIIDFVTFEKFEFRKNIIPSEIFESDDKFFNHKYYGYKSDESYFTPIHARLISEAKEKILISFSMGKYYSSESVALTALNKIIRLRNLYYIPKEKRDLVCIINGTSTSEYDSLNPDFFSDIAYKNLLVDIRDYTCYDSVKDRVKEMLISRNMITIEEEIKMHSEAVQRRRIEQEEKEVQKKALKDATNGIASLKRNQKELERQIEETKSIVRRALDGEALSDAIKRYENSKEQDIKANNRLAEYYYRDGRSFGGLS